MERLKIGQNRHEHRDQRDSDGDRRADHTPQGRFGRQGPKVAADVHHFHADVGQQRFDMLHPRVSCVSPLFEGSHPEIDDVTHAIMLVNSYSIGKPAIRAIYNRHGTGTGTLKGRG
jgi:hypothetical protein